MLEYQSIFKKCYTPNWSEEVFMIKKIKILYHGYVIQDLNGERIFGTFYEKKYAKDNSNCLDLKK